MKRRELTVNSSQFRIEIEELVTLTALVVAGWVTASLIAHAVIGS